MAVAEEILSPELVLVSPPDVAAQARQALPDFEREWQELVTRLRIKAAVAAEEPEPPARLTLGAVAFTAAAALTSVAPLVLLIVFR